MSWQAWMPQKVQTQTWKQGWRGPTYRTTPAPPYPMHQQYT
jgi:hypothetical protein